MKHFKIFLSLLLCFCWISLVNLNQSGQEFQYQLDYRAVEATAVLSNQNPQVLVIAQELKKLHQLKCLDLTTPKDMPINFLELNGNCQEDREWLSRNFIKWYLQFLFLHPEVVVKLLSFGVLAGNSPFGFYSGSASIAPKSFSLLFFGERNYALRLSETTNANFATDKLVAFTPLIGWGLGFILLQIRARNRYLRLEVDSKGSAFDFIRKMSMALFTASFIGFFVLSVFSPTEWFRQTIQFQVLFFISTLIILSKVIEERINKR